MLGAPFFPSGRTLLSHRLPAPSGFHLPLASVRKGVSYSLDTSDLIKAAPRGGFCAAPIECPTPRRPLKDSERLIPWPVLAGRINFARQDSYERSCALSAPLLLSSDPLRPDAVLPLDDQVKVVFREAAGMNPPSGFAAHLRQDVQEKLPIAVVPEAPVPPVAPTRSRKHSEFMTWSIASGHSILNWRARGD